MVSRRSVGVRAPAFLSRPPSHGQAFVVLCSLFLARARRQWRPYLVVSTAMPSGIVLLLGLVGHLGRTAGSIATVGAMDLVLGITAVTLLAQQVSEAVHNGYFDMLRTLPVAPVLVLLALFVSAGIFAVPGLVVVALLGHLLYGAALRPDLGVPVVLVLTSLALGGIGAFVGLAANSEAVAGLIGNLVMMLVLFLGIVPARHMPAWVILVRDVLPVGAAADALGTTLRAGVPAPWQIAVLCAWTVAGAVAVSRRALSERRRGL